MNIFTLCLYLNSLGKSRFKLQSLKDRDIMTFLKRNTCVEGFQVLLFSEEQKTCDFFKRINKLTACDFPRNFRRGCCWNSLNFEIEELEKMFSNKKRKRQRAMGMGVRGRGSKEEEVKWQRVSWVLLRVFLVPRVLILFCFPTIVSRLFSLIL